MRESMYGCARADLVCVCVLCMCLWRNRKLGVRFSVVKHTRTELVKNSELKEAGLTVFQDLPDHRHPPPPPLGEGAPHGPCAGSRTTASCTPQPKYETPNLK